MSQDDLQKAKERYSDAVEAFKEQRERMVEDLEFSNPANPKQWDSRDLDIRQKGADGSRPCLTLDRTNQYIAQVVNDARQNKPGIEFLPSSSGANQDVATALNGFMRHIEYRSRASLAYDTAIDHAARIGIGWARIMPEVVDEALNYQEIRIQRIHDPLSVLGDPDWCEPDGSDLQYCFLESTLSKDAFKLFYPKNDVNSWGDDTKWFGKDTVKICEYFDLKKSKVNMLTVSTPDGLRRSLTEEEYWAECKKIGYHLQVDSQYSATKQKVIWRKMSGAEILEETTFPSQYIPLVPMVGHELWVEGKRYLCGMTRRMADAQRLYNYERSAWAEAVALQPKAPFLVADESVDDFAADWARANRANLGYLRFKAYTEDGRQLPMPKRSEPPQMPSAFAQGAQFADADIQASIGMYRANLGAPSNETSGKAINARKMEGDTANYHYIDNQNLFIARIGVIVLDMIPSIYDEPREAAILGHDGSTQKLKIDPHGSAYEVRGDTTIINPSTGTYAVRVKAGPSYTSLREEASSSLSQIMSNPNLAPIVGPIWARMQDWPESDKLAKALLAMAPPPVQNALNEGNKKDDPEVLQQQLAQASQQLQAMQQQMQEMHSGLMDAAQEHDQSQREIQRLQMQLAEEKTNNASVMLDALTRRMDMFLKNGLKPPEIDISPQIDAAMIEEITDPDNEQQELQPAQAGFFTNEAQQ